MKSYGNMDDDDDLSILQLLTFRPRGISPRGLVEWSFWNIQKAA